jgi:hypothetical protein
MIPNACKRLTCKHSLYLGSVAVGVATSIYTLQPLLEQQKAAREASGSPRPPAPKEDAA